MPAQSKSQQILMGQAYAVKTGKLKIEDVDSKYRDKVEKLSKSMTTKELKDFAQTKHDDLPYKKECFNILSFNNYINEFFLNNTALNPGMTVPGMGPTKIPSNPDTPLSQQTTGSGDSLYIPGEIESRKPNKKKKKKKKNPENKSEL